MFSVSVSMKPPLTSVIIQRLASTHIPVCVDPVRTPGGGTSPVRRRLAAHVSTEGAGWGDLARPLTSLSWGYTQPPSLHTWYTQPPCLHTWYTLSCLHIPVFSGVADLQDSWGFCVLFVLYICV